VGVLNGYLQNMRDKSIASGALRAITDIKWKTQFRFVSWCAEKVRHLQRWGGSCYCHASDFAAGIPVDGPLKGRLLPWAWHKVREVFDAMVQQTTQ
jgi:hypothetical protein